MHSIAKNTLAAAAMSLLALSAGAQGNFHPEREAPRPAQNGVVDFLRPINPDPVLQHSKEIYVTYGCAYCHGVDLKVQNGEAADLLHSPIVAADTDGALIVQILKVGIPQTAKLSPMPQFSDLSQGEMEAIARWIHYSRQEEHYKELNAGARPAGDAAAGKRYFDATCASCHSAAAMAATAKKYGDTVIDHAIRPALVEATQSFRVEAMHDAAMNKAKQTHGHLLENYTAQQVADLGAYLGTLR